MTNLNTVLMVGAVALGVIYYVYEYWISERPGRESPHSRGRRSSKSEETQRIVKPPTAEEDCPICLERLIGNVTRKTCLQALPECGHWFHKKCLIRLLEYHPHCPVCRKNIDSSMIVNAPVRVVQVEDESLNSSLEPSTSRRRCFLNSIEYDE